MPELQQRDPEGAVSASTDGDRAGAPSAFHGDAAEGLDWKAAERLPEFRELVSKRRSFVIPVLGFSLLWYFAFITLAAFAPDFLGKTLTGDVTVGFGLALTQFAMVWGLTWLYLRKARRDFDPLTARAAQRLSR